MVSDIGNQNNALKSDLRSDDDDMIEGQKALGVGQTEKPQLKNILKTVGTLLRNPIYVCLITASSIEGLIQNSSLAFAPIFFEYQYRIASGSASLLIGAIAIPSLIVGSLFSGFLIKRFNWQMKQCLVFIIVLLSLHVVTYTGFLFGCKEQNFIFNRDYVAQKSVESQLEINGIDFDCYTNLNQTTMCDCDRNIFKPVCLKTSYDIVFESACIAGCKSYSKELSQYSNCPHAQCISDRLSTMFNESKSPIVLDNGSCERPSACQYKLYITYVSIFLVMFITAMLYIPYMKVTVGCIASKPEMNAIALGIKHLAMTCIGTIPGPIIFGSVIDLSCKYWYTDCLNQTVCKVYDNQRFSMSYGFMGIGFKLVCLTSTTLAFVFLKTKKYTF
jgi:hypothetical protein